MRKYQDIGILILRISIGGNMLPHGIKKIFTGIDSIVKMVGEAGLPEFISYGVFVGEVIAPLMIIIGYKTKIASIILAINMIFAIYLAHAEDIFKLSKSGAWAIELQSIYLFAAIVFIFTGAGKYALSKSSIWD
ncbi:MAG: DoxX family protein [Bacteroidales bacterium]|nr:DoxX family protein [Bacteroidales bacterium]